MEFPCRRGVEVVTSYDILAVNPEGTRIVHAYTAHGVAIRFRDIEVDGEDLDAGVGRIIYSVVACLSRTLLSGDSLCDNAPIFFAQCVPNSHYDALIRQVDSHIPEATARKHRRLQELSMQVSAKIIGM